MIFQISTGKFKYTSQFLKLDINVVFVWSENTIYKYWQRRIFEGEYYVWICVFKSERWWGFARWDIFESLLNPTYLRVKSWKIFFNPRLFLTCIHLMKERNRFSWDETYSIMHSTQTIIDSHDGITDSNQAYIIVSNKQHNRFTQRGN